MIDVSVMTDQLGLDFEDAVKQLAEWGIAWVDLRSGVYGKAIDDVTDSEVERAQAVLDKHRLQVACLATRLASPWKDHDLWDEKDWDEELLHLDRLIALARAFGTNMLRVYAYRKPNPDVALDRPDLEEFLEPVSRRLREAAEIAADQGLVLVLENETFSLVGTCSELRQVVDAVDHEALLACWDVANGWACGEQPYPDGYDQIRDSIGYVHIKGAKSRPDDPSVYGGVALVGQDDLDYGSVLGALIRDGYDGKVALHPHHNLFPDQYKLVGEQNPDLTATWLTLKRVRELLAASNEGD
jgi:sugar phosphate isomerase/epimerase